MALSMIKMICSDLKLFFLLSTIVLATAGFIEQKSTVKGKVTKVLTTTSESSKLQCLHRCKFINDDVKAHFDNGECKCFEVDEEGNGAVSELFITKKIEQLKLKAVEIVEINPVNVASGKPAAQSSTFKTYGAKRANDGNCRSSISIVDGKNPKWWEVNLEKTVEVKLIKLFLNKVPLSKGHYKNMKVSTKKPGDIDYTLCRDIGTPSTTEINVVCNTNNIKAQYIRVSKDDDHYLQLFEVEVYAW